MTKTVHFKIPAAKKPGADRWVEDRALTEQEPAESRCSARQ